MHYDLKYLFRAEFRDGTVYDQHIDDLPQISPVGSSYTDIISRLDDVARFSLRVKYAPEIADNVCLVNLDTGKFTVCGQEITVNTSPAPPEGEELNLIYFRAVTYTRVDAGSETSESVEVEYHIGYQFTIDGKQHQRTISVR